jgi:hypothetical protein
LIPMIAVLATGKFRVGAVSRMGIMAFGIRNAEFVLRNSDFGFWIKVSGVSWSLVSGCWSLVTDCGNSELRVAVCAELHSA